MNTENTEAKVRDLEHVIQEKEREIQMLRDNIHNYNNGNPVTEERIVKLERELNELNGLVRGLTAEMLDLKAWVQKLSKSIDESPVPRRIVTDEKKEEKKRSYPIVETPSSAAERKSADKIRKDEHVTKIDDTLGARDGMLILQPDGTMKREEKFGDDMIIAGNGGRGGNTRSNARSADTRPLIYADDDDAVEVKRKRK